MAFTGNAACNVFKIGLLDGGYDFGTGTTDVYKIALYTNAATLDSNTTAYTVTGEVVASGYTAGGETLTISQVPTVGSQTGSGASAYISFSNVSWSGVITARGALVYKFNGTTNPAVCVLDFGSDKTSTTTFQVQFPTASETSAIIRLG
jgi:hypothetical protein